MALGPIQAVVATGLTPNWQTPTATENLASGGRNLVLYVKNSGGGAGTVTLVDPGITPAGSAAVNPAVTIPATTGEKEIFLPAGLTNPATGNIQVTFSGGTLTAYAKYYG